MCWIATTTLLVLLLMAETQAAGQTSQHHADLWCTGTPQENGGTDHELWPGHQILGVNFANQTVIGFGIVARIEKMLISIPFRSAAKGLLIVVRRSLERSPWRAPLIAYRCRVGARGSILRFGPKQRDCPPCQLHLQGHVGNHRLLVNTFRPFGNQITPIASLALSQAFRGCAANPFCSIPMTTKRYEGVKQKQYLGRLLRWLQRYSTD